MQTDEFEMPDIEERDDVEKREIEDVKKIAQEYELARKHDNYAREQYLENRSYATGKKQDEWASSANIIGSFIDILTSFLYARDPDVSAQASQSVGGVEQTAVSFAETAGIVVSRLWKRARLKSRVRKQLRSSLSVGPGWLKVIMTHETRVDPKVQAELNDLEDNVNRLNATMAELSEGDMEFEEIMTKQSDAERLRTSLQERLEVVFRYGLGIDFVHAEDMQVSLDVGSIADHLDGNWNSNDLYVPIQDLRTEFPRLSDKDVKSATVFYQQKPTKQDEQNPTDKPRFAQHGGGDDSIGFAKVVELWDKRDNHIKTFVVGVPRWAVEPYQPPYASTRFYPYFNLSLFEVDGERHPQSLTERLDSLQDEYSSKRSNSRITAERSVPGVLFDKQGVSDSDMRKVANSVAQEFTGIDVIKGDDIRKIFVEKPVPKADPLIFSTLPVMQDMERIAGVQEALSQSVSVAKTATEAKIQQTGFTSRTSADRDTLETMLQDLAEYTLELSIQALPPEYVQRLAGLQAFWPHGMNVEDIITLAEIEIKAGTTGKPDEESLRQSWSVLLPLIQSVMVEIQKAQLTGNLPMAEALRSLVEETFRRLDERIDVDKFIPSGLPDLTAAVQLINESAGATGAENPKTPAETSADANTLE